MATKGWLQCKADGMLACFRRSYFFVMRFAVLTGVAAESALEVNTVLVAERVMMRVGIGRQ